MNAVDTNVLIYAADSDDREKGPVAVTLLDRLRWYQRPARPPTFHRRRRMEIKRGGSQPSRPGPAEYFTGTVRIDPLFEAPRPQTPRACSASASPSSPAPAPTGTPTRAARP